MSNRKRDETDDFTDQRQFQPEELQETGGEPEPPPADPPTEPGGGVIPSGGGDG